MADRYKVVGEGEVPYEGTPEDLTSYGVWKVIHAKSGRLVCGFFGGAAGLAATEFCDKINSDPNWNTPEHED